MPLYGLVRYSVAKLLFHISLYLLAFTGLKSGFDVADDDDDDDVQVLDSDPEDRHVIHEISHDAESSAFSKPSQSKSRSENSSIDMIVAAAVHNLDAESCAGDNVDNVNEDDKDNEGNGESSEKAEVDGNEADTDKKQENKGAQGDGNKGTEKGVD